LAARVVTRLFWPVTPISMSGVVPLTMRRPAGGETCLLETLAPSFERLIPLRSATSSSTPPLWTISLTVLGFVASPGTGALPVGENGWPR
jgi:hypothetical protein